MILLQASICLSAGVFSLVHSGPSWALVCAVAGTAHSAAATIASVKMKRRIKSPGHVFWFVAGAGLRVQDKMLPDGPDPPCDPATRRANNLGNLSTPLSSPVCKNILIFRRGKSL